MKSALWDIQVLHNMLIPDEMLHCDDIMHENPTHIQQILEYWASIKKCCIDTRNEAFPKVKAHKSNKPYWNSIVKAQYSDYFHIANSCSIG